MRRGKQPAKQTNPRLAKVLRSMGRGDTLTKASKKAGYSCVQAASNAIRRAKEKMSDVLDRHGLTDDALVKDYLRPLMKANEVQFFQHQGIVLDKRVVPALGIRSGALDMALKLKGSYPKNGDDKHNGNGINIDKAIVLAPELFKNPEVAKILAESDA